MLALSKRRRYQFSLRTLLSLPLLFAVGWLIFSAGWWWVTWPERTAVKYREVLLHGTADEANAFFSPSTVPVSMEMSFDEESFQDAVREHFWPGRRSMRDFFLARQYFEVPGLFSEHKGFVVERGKVVAVFGFDYYIPSDFSLSIERKAAIQEAFRLDLHN